MADKRIAAYPKYYKQNRWGSDKAWIFSRLRVMPKSRHKEVSIKYESLFRCDPHGEGRDNANNYLNDTAREYISDSNTKTKVI